MERTLEIPVTESTQRALHEASARFYDEIAETMVDGDETIPPQLLEGTEEFYVATAEESITSVTITFEFEADDGAERVEEGEPRDG